MICQFPNQMVTVVITLPSHLQVYSHNDVPNPEGTADLCWFCLLFHPCCLGSSGLSGWRLWCGWIGSSCSLLTACLSAWLSAITSNSAILSCWCTSVRCSSNFFTSCSSFVASVSYWPTYLINTCFYYNFLKACDIGYQLCHDCVRHWYLTLTTLHELVLLSSPAEGSLF